MGFSNRSMVVLSASIFDSEAVIMQRYWSNLSDVQTREFRQKKRK